MTKFDNAKPCGGERGIRTLGTAFGSTHDFQSCSFSQLGHLSGIPRITSSGGEGGIRTHDPVFTGYRFSRAGPSATRQPLPWTSGSRHNGHDPSSHNPFGILCQYARRLHFIACVRFLFLVSTSCSRGTVLTLSHFVTSWLDRSPEGSNMVSGLGGFFLWPALCLFEAFFTIGKRFTI